jgi:hypothetical protein
MAQLEEQQPSPPAIIGCMDRYALNYDVSATMPCDNCCKYTTTEVIIGCMDRLASNYNSSATKSCDDCCRFDTAYNPPILVGYPGEVVPVLPVDTYPYQVNPEGANCLRDVEKYNPTWVISEGASNIYSSGFHQYREDLETITNGTTPPYVPNWGSDGTMAQIWAAFDVLLINKPNSRVFINNWGLTPWIIPLYSETDTLTPNPNRERFISDCSKVGGEMYIYDGTSNTTIPQLEQELKGVEQVRTQTQQDSEDWGVYLDTLEREPTPEEMVETERLTILVDDQNKLIDELGDTMAAEELQPSISNPKNHFMACLCNVVDIIEPVECKTISNNGEVFTISPTTSECVKDGTVFIDFLRGNLNYSGLINPDGSGGVSPTTYFNTFLFTSLGVSVDDAQFIMENFYNYTPAYYPYNGTTLDIINGASRCNNIIKNAFLNGANIWLPLESTRSSDIVHTRECCEDVLGGVYKEGTYNNSVSSFLDSDDNIIRESTTQSAGVCLCNEIKEPCPTLTDGTIEPIVEFFDTSDGTVTSTYLNVSEDCCSNDSLQSNMAGNWTWDSTTKRCILVDEVDGNVCKESTIITISETPINIKDVECVEDTVTITAYIFFEEPGNKCTDGGLVTNSTPLGGDIISLYQNPPTNAEEISRYSNDKNWDVTSGLDGVGGFPQSPVEPTQTTNCCYDTNTPIDGILILQNENNVKIDNPNITYVERFSSIQPNISTSTNISSGFGGWVRLTTVVDISTLTSGVFNIGVEFTQGLFKCCDYNIYFDDINVNCEHAGVREIYNTEKCPGFELRHVIDNKKSWVYNPGTNIMSDSVEDNIIRGNGTLGMNIAQSNPHIIDGGHGAINRVFAPSVDAELPFRDTDYFGFHGVIEKHSKLVLNSKEVKLQFNMCADDDCAINPEFLIDDFGGYVLDDDGGRIIVGPYTPFPNLLQLETFKKTFQGFWVQFMEQFIPATTIFVSGEKWCNSFVCEEIPIEDYCFGVESGSNVISPAPVTETIVEPTNPNPPNVSTQPTQNTGNVGSTGGVGTEGETGTTNTDVIGPVVIGDVRIYSLETLDPEEASSVTYTTIVAST